MRNKFSFSKYRRLIFQPIKFKYLPRIRLNTIPKMALILIYLSFGKFIFLNWPDLCLKKLLCYSGFRLFDFYWQLFCCYCISLDWLQKHKPYLFCFCTAIWTTYFSYVCVFLVKGQIISKCLFGVFNFFQKTNENTSNSSKNELICSFFEGIHSLTICFRN